MTEWFHANAHALGIAGAMVGTLIVSFMVVLTFARHMPKTTRKTEIVSSAVAVFCMAVCNFIFMVGHHL